MVNHNVDNPDSPPTLDPVCVLFVSFPDPAGA